jgi:NSS family neurotransmitter:Na+ symporter
MDQFNISRTKAGIIEGAVALIGGIIVCLGYNKLYFEIKLPNGNMAQILDIMDYVSNNMLMPVVAFSTCILVGWVLKPETIIAEVEKTVKRWGEKGFTG